MIQLALEKQTMLLKKRCRISNQCYEKSNLILNLCENGDFNYNNLEKDF